MKSSSAAHFCEDQCKDPEILQGICDDNKVKKCRKILYLTDAMTVPREGKSFSLKASGLTQTVNSGVSISFSFWLIINCHMKFIEQLNFISLFSGNLGGGVQRLQVTHTKCFNFLSLPLAMFC